MLERVDAVIFNYTFTIHLEQVCMVPSNFFFRALHLNAIFKGVVAICPQTTSQVSTLSEINKDVGIGLSMTSCRLETILWIEVGCRDIVFLDMWVYNT